MAFKHYIVAVANSATETICTAGTGKEIAIVDITITAGADGGEIAIIATDASSNTHTLPLTLAANDTVILTNKRLLPPGYSLSAKSISGAFEISASGSEDTI